MTRVPPQPIKRQTMNADEVADHRKRMAKLKPYQPSKVMPKGETLPDEVVEVDLYRGEK